MSIDYCKLVSIVYMYRCFFIRLASIHADAPEFVEMSVEQEILVTGIKVVDLLAPYAKGGKIGEKISSLIFTLLLERKSRQVPQH